ncbi:hypothetical protein MMC32_007828 [Xylographa parallela]|nr:hypothetical protein [Xylographa parallela]
MYTTILLLSKPSVLYSTAPHSLETGACRTNRLADDRHPVFDDFPMERQERVLDEVAEGGSPYSGRPNARTERAWEEMLGVGIISITAEEYDRFRGLTAPDRRNDGRYVVVLDMFHQLHCVKVLRDQVFTPRIRAANGLAAEWEVHMDHCVEFLRQTIMCQASNTPASLYWNTDIKSYAAQHGMRRMCSDFDSIWNWASDRNITGA